MSASSFEDLVGKISNALLSIEDLSGIDVFKPRSQALLGLGKDRKLEVWVSTEDASPIPEPLLDLPRKVTKGQGYTFERMYPGATLLLGEGNFVVFKGMFLKEPCRVGQCSDRVFGCHINLVSFTTVWRELLDPLYRDISAEITRDSILADLLMHLEIMEQLLKDPCCPATTYLEF